MCNRCSPVFLFVIIHLTSSKTVTSSNAQLYSSPFCKMPSLTNKLPHFFWSRFLHFLFSTHSVRDHICCPYILPLNLAQSFSSISVLPFGMLPLSLFLKCSIITIYSSFSCNYPAFFSFPLFIYFFIFNTITNNMWSLSNVFRE